MQFTHYTRDISAIGKILVNGFAYVPNRRNLIVNFLPRHDFGEREAQEFGMVSFTELATDRAQDARKLFGNYGIMVSEKWASSHHMQKVLYVARDGPVFEAFRWLFQRAYKDLTDKISFPDDAAWQMAFTNKEMAGVAGGLLYGNLLQIYEYMEPIEHSYQQEWRIVHPHPVYGYAKETQEVIENVSPPEGWAKFVHVIPLVYANVVGFVCPAGEEDVFRGALPAEYKAKYVATFET